jgi:hypothetical protein
MPPTTRIPRLSEIAAALEEQLSALDRQQDRPPTDLAPRHRAAITLAYLHINAAIRSIRISLSGGTPTREWPPAPKPK